MCDSNHYWLAWTWGLLKSIKIKALSGYHHLFHCITYHWFWVTHVQTTPNSGTSGAFCSSLGCGRWSTTWSIDRASLRWTIWTCWIMGLFEPLQGETRKKHGIGWKFVVSGIYQNNNVTKNMVQQVQIMTHVDKNKYPWYVGGCSGNLQTRQVITSMWVASSASNECSKHPPILARLTHMFCVRVRQTNGKLIQVNHNHHQTQKAYSVNLV